ncbi:MAG: tripartite tricarboxylate transporter substrate binding protein [Phreatobacter sp.]|uniref:Bug family tripartite tricarboxylate transporter substrate binding protein n=1 Tax=Phreatobacter sp. TaxID=1966341 RepID=UPI001A583020|nr:tripartite tricarboxylate transporter substrate binding protein [Phreatobacter sp.]MBL8571865.1 tripartite tricarboxylate transporter substrate binding protein [Phreatobacter sp.]
MRKTTTAILGGVALAALALVGGAEAAWPERPVTIIVPAGAGGGTDGTARLLAKQLQDELKQPFNIVNNGQGGGIVGHTQIATARPDGYTLGIVYNYYQWKMLGQADINYTLYTPIALYNVDPSALIVADTSPFKTGKDAYDALKADGGKYKIGCGGACGGSWHIPNAELFIKYGIDVKKPVMVPAAGAAPSLQDLASGGLDMVMASLPEAKALIEAGKLRPLMVIANGRQGAPFQNVPTSKEAVGIDHEGGAFRLVAGPKGLPADIVKTLETTLEKIWKSQEFQDGMKQRNFGLKWMNSAQTLEFMKGHEKSLAETIVAVGLAK